MLAATIAMNETRPTGISSSSRGTRILAVAPAVPRQDTNAADRRLVALLRILANDHMIDFLPLSGTDSSSIPARYVTGLEELGVNVLPDWGGFSAALAAHAIYDVVFFEYYHTAENRIEKVRKVYPNARIVVDTVDVHFARERAGEMLGRCRGMDGPNSEDTRRRELAVYRDADLVVAVTSEDDRLLEAEGGIHRRLLIPLIVPMRTRPRMRRDPIVLFVGGFAHPPNVDGITWFVDVVWDRIRNHRPDARLLIVGSDPPEEVRMLNGRAGVEVVGYVPDTGPYLDRAAISIAPLRYGAGMKGKVTEALASGVPVVATRFGAQGFGGTSGIHLLVADAELALADAVGSLLDDPVRAEIIGAAGQDLVAGLCSEDAVAPTVLEGFQGLIGDRRRPRRPSAAWIIHALGVRARKGIRHVALKTGLLPLYRLLRCQLARNLSH